MDEDKELMLTILDAAKQVVNSTNRAFEMSIIRDDEQQIFSKKKNDVISVKFVFRKQFTE